MHFNLKIFTFSWNLFVLVLVNIMFEDISKNFADFQKLEMKYDESIEIFWKRNEDRVRWN